jgi:hypothetical protein
MVPEVPYGTIIFMATFVGATGLYLVRKKKPE